MKTRLIILTGIALLSMVMLGWWYSRHRAALNAIGEVSKKADATEQGGQPSGSANMRRPTFPKEDDPYDEPEVIVTHLSLEEANAVLKELLDVELPSGTRSIENGHFVMSKDEAKQLLEQIRSRAKAITETRVNRPSEDKWESFGGSTAKIDFYPQYTPHVKMTAGTVGYTMAPKWSGMIPAFGILLDPATGVCLFIKQSNYDP